MSAYNTKRFKLLRKFDLDFYIENDHILSTQNVAQFLLLESRITGKKFLSANCHLLFDRDRGDTKYFQAALIMSAITEIQKLYRSLVLSSRAKRLHGVGRRLQHIALFAALQLCEILESGRLEAIHCR